MNKEHHTRQESRGGTSQISSCSKIRSSSSSNGPVLVTPNLQLMASRHQTHLHRVTLPKSFKGRSHSFEFKSNTSSAAMNSELTRWATPEELLNKMLMCLSHYASIHFLFNWNTVDWKFLKLLRLVVAGFFFFFGGGVGADHLSFFKKNKKKWVLDYIFFLSFCLQIYARHHPKLAILERFT